MSFVMIKNDAKVTQGLNYSARNQNHLDTLTTYDSMWECVVFPMSDSVATA